VVVSNVELSCVSSSVSGPCEWIRQDVLVLSQHAMRGGSDRVPNNGRASNADSSTQQKAKAPPLAGEHKVETETGGIREASVLAIDQHNAAGRSAVT